MEYDLKAAMQPVHAHVEVHEDRNIKISVNDRLYDLHYNLISGHQIHMVLKQGGETRQINAYLADCTEGKIICINGRQYQVNDLENGTKIKKGAAQSLPEQMTPPMPAVVVRISVQVGDMVEKGQSIIVVSAMKMETALCAPYSGKVVKINCAISDKVSPGQILAVIEKAEM